jgi:hypothetical protein
MSDSPQHVIADEGPDSAHMADLVGSAARSAAITCVVRVPPQRLRLFILQRSASMPAS